MSRNPCRGWKHGDPVTKESSRREEVSRGTVAVRKAKAGHFYVQVLLGTSCYDWPDQWVLGVGRYAARCLQCEQRFRTDSTYPDFCPACLRDEQQEHAADSGIRKPLAYMRGAVTPRPKVKPYTREELDAIERQRAKDAQESPF